MLQEFVPGLIYRAEAPLKFKGVPVGARMVVCKLADGGLLVHSPLQPTPELVAAVRALGPVRCIVAPNCLHHLYAGDFAEAFPEAQLYISPRLPKKRPDLAAKAEVLTDAPPALYAADLDQAVIQGSSLIDEVVFFHKKARTLILTDLCMSAHPHSPGLWRWTAWLLGVYGRPSVSLEVKLSFRDRPALREVLERVLEWDFERVIFAHGDPVESDGKAMLRRACAFALK